jgi:hypothetical protein
MWTSTDASSAYHRVSSPRPQPKGRMPCSSSATPPPCKVPLMWTQRRPATGPASRLRASTRAAPTYGVYSAGWRTLQHSYSSRIGGACGEVPPSRSRNAGRWSRSLPCAEFPGPFLGWRPFKRCDAICHPPRRLVYAIGLRHPDHGLVDGQDGCRRAWSKTGQASAARSRSERWSAVAPIGTTREDGKLVALTSSSRQQSQRPGC